MDLSNGSRLIAADSDRFFVNTEFIQNEHNGAGLKDVLEPNMNVFFENNLLEMRTDKRTILLDEPDMNFGGIAPKIEIDESDFMHIAIDEIKTEWPNELKLPTFEEHVPSTKVPMWVPPIVRPESPLPTLSDFTFNDILANLPPVSPPPEEPPLEHFLPENFSLVKLENTEVAHQPLMSSYSESVELPLNLHKSQQTTDNDASTKDSLSALLLPSVEPAAVPAKAKKIRLPDVKDDDIKGKDTESDTSWHESSDEEFGKKFEREEHMEEILKNYHRGGINTDDNCIYCDLCNRRWNQKCPQHGTLNTHIKNRQVPMGTEDRARKTAPHFLSVLKSKIRGANKGVWTSKNIPRRTYFGPYEGCVVPTDHPKGEYCWKVMKDGKEDFLIDGSDPNKSNWMRYVNCARTVDEQNLEAFQYRKTIYYRTTKDIKAKDELLVWYGYKFARKLGIKWKDYVESHLPNKKGVVFSCDECFHAYSNPILMEEHKKRQHLHRVSSKDPSKMTVNTEAKKGPVHKNDSLICMEVTTGDKPITCGVCGARFRRRGRPLQSHMREHADQKHTCCSRCGQWFPHLISLNEHRTAAAQARKNKTGNAVCSTDYKVRPKPTKTVTSKLPPKRTRKFRSKTSTSEEHPLRVAGHIKKAEKDTSKFSLCDKCGAMYPRKCLLFAHMEKKHHVPVDKKKVEIKKKLPAKRFKCAECGISYRDRSTLKSHLKIHEEQTSESEVMDDVGEELPFKCDVCGMKFRAAITLKYHRTVHEKTVLNPSKNLDHKRNPPKKYKCKVCKVRFRARSTLDLHAKTHKINDHSKLMSIKTLYSSLASGSIGTGKNVLKETVPVCSKDVQKKQFFVSEEHKLAKREERLKRELENLSDNILQRKRRRISSMECLACGFIFKDRSTLDAHVFKHTTEKMWVCDLSSVRIPLT